MSKEQQFDYQVYGAKVSSLEIENLLNHLFESYPDHKNFVPVPLCIWGMHGIGKTQLIKEYAQRNGYHFRYIAPAQFEEMGDLVGMPKITTKESGHTETSIVPPSWVPQQDGPGIFLIDDVNRADDRILRGIMQLLQDHELVSWKLPSKWMIVLTANPDGGDYSVTPMDDAMLTRMMHVTLEFDVKSWAKWAELSNVDPRGIAFVLAYPEIVTGGRTTPRSLVQFFGSIKQIRDLKDNLSMVKILADGCLDPQTAISFINFVSMDLGKLVTPEEILNASKFESIHNRVEDLVEGKVKRLDILSVILTRLTNYLIFSKSDLTDKQFENLKKFIQLPTIPNDLRLAMAQEVVKSEKKSAKRLYAVPEVGKLLLTKM